MPNSRHKNTTELAIAFENVMSLIDIARKDIVEIDKMIRTGVNGKPSILIDLDRLKQNIMHLEEKMEKVESFINEYDIDAINTDVASDHEVRLVKVEKKIGKIIGWSSGILSILGIIVMYGASLLKIIKEFVG